MPKVIPYIGIAVVSYFSAGTLGAPLAAALGAAQAGLVYTAQRGQGGNKNTAQDQTMTIRSGTAARAYVLGARRTRGAILDAEWNPAPITTRRT